MHKHYIIIVIILLALGMPLWAQTSGGANSFSLKEAQDYALKNNPTGEDKRMDLESAQYQIKEIRATGLPQVNANVNYQYFLKLPVSLVPGETFADPSLPPEQVPEYIELTFGTKNNMTAGIEASQLIFNGSYLVALEAAKTYIKLAELEAVKSEKDILDAVTKAYFTILISEQSERLLEKNIENLSKIRFETVQLFENGFVEEIEVDRLSLSLTNLRTQLQNAVRQTEMAEWLLKYQMGYDMNEEIALRDSIESLIEEAKVDLASLKSKERVELQIMGVQNELNDLDIKRIRSEYLPSLAAFGSLQYAFQRDDFRVFTEKWYPTAVVGLQLNVPIFDGMRKKYQIMQKEVNTLKLNNGRELMKRSFALETQQAKTNYSNAITQVDSQKQSLALAEKIYNVALIKYKEGLGSSLEVTSSESQLYETQGLYVQAVYNLIVAKSDLDKALGNY